MKNALFVCCLILPALSVCGANAQNIAAECPTLSENAENGLRWQVHQTPDILLCRAIRSDDGKEAFAVTIAHSTPFKPNSELREREGVIAGQKIYWYRSEIPGRPNEIVRETAVNIGLNNVAHIFIRTTATEEMGRYQEIVQNLKFESSQVQN